MTTTTDTPAEAEPQPEEERCPKCQGTVKQVPDTDVMHCDSCGWTGGEGKPASTSSMEVRRGDPERGERELNAATMEALHGADPIPDRQAFLTMAATARMLSMSAATPPAMRDPYVAFHVVMMGRALNLDPASAMNLIDVIGYDKNAQTQDKLQLSLSPELLVARVAMMGVGSVELLWATKTRAAAVALHPGGKVIRATKNAGDVKIGDVVEIIGEKGRVEFDWDMAEEAELTDDRCVWNSELDVVIHWKKVNTNGRGWTNNTPNGCRCGSYKKHPGRMMGWRAMGFCVHTYFPQASLGLYSAEELGAPVDDNGRAIDVTTVELPEGYNTTAATTGGPPAANIEPADPAAIDEIRKRVKVLPDNRKQEFLGRWADKVKEGRLPKLDDLLGSQVALALALVSGAEALAKQDGWKPPPEAPPTPTGEAAPASPGPPPAPPAPSPAETGSEAPERPTEGQPTEPQLTGAAAQVGQALPVVTPQHEERAVQIVKPMTVRQLNGALRERSMEVDKISENQRRYNLAKKIAEEFADADWQEANK